MRVGNKVLYSFIKKPFFTEFFEKVFPLIGPKRQLFKRVPSFQNLSDEEISKHTNIDPHYSFRNQIYWTPRFYLHKELSSEFLFELKKFKHIDNWTNSEMLALTQLILTEAIRDTTYEIAYNYQVKPSIMCPFHGSIDILLYNNVKEDNYLPVVPIIFPAEVKPFLNHESYQRYNMPQLVGICYAMLTDFKARNLDIDHIRAFHTNGTEWCLYEIHDNYVKKTKFFRSERIKLDKQRAQIYEDTQHVEAVIGLLRYALSKNLWITFRY
jgi:hypothetical protein